MSVSMRLLLILLLLAGCNGGGGGSSRKQEDTTSANPVEPSKEIQKQVKFSFNRTVTLRSDLSNLEAFKRDINTFEIRANAIAGDFKGQQVICELLDAEESKSFKGTFDYDGKLAIVPIHLNVSSFEADQFQCVINDKTFLKSEPIKIKKSWIVDWQIDIRKYEKGKLDLDTMVIGKEGVLYGNNSNIHLKLKSLVSLNGRIATYLNGSRAKWDSDGSSGGLIEISAAQAIGQLTVELRGENGGEQSQVPPTIEGRSVTPDYLHGKCGDNMENTNGQCEGKKGLTGLAGEPGYSGFSGGDTGALNLTVKNLNLLKLKIAYYPGQGSEGGEGGAGQQGGEGGKGSLVRYYNEHGGGPHRIQKSFNEARKKYKDGQEGDRGQKGARGARGYDGFINPSTLMILDSSEVLDITESWEN